MSALGCAQSDSLWFWNGNPTAVPERLFDAMNQLYGLNTSGFNEMFCKFFKTEAGMAPREYFFYQLLHHFTTYRAEATVHETWGTVPEDAVSVLKYLMQHRTDYFCAVLPPGGDERHRLPGLLSHQPGWWFYGLKRVRIKQSPKSFTSSAIALSAAEL